MQSPSSSVQSNVAAAPLGSFSGLVKNCVYGICLNIKKQVLATHKELKILRRCSELVSNKPGRVVYVVTSEPQKKNFIVNTLLHHGVSCGQVRVDLLQQDECAPEGIWLFVANA